MKLRMLLSSALFLSTMWLGGCGHYTCGTTFGNSSCTASGEGISQDGGGGAISQTAFVYFMDDSTAQMALEGLNVANSQTFGSVSSFVSPVFPVNALGANGGLVIVNKNFLYMPFANGDLYGFSIDATGTLNAVPNSFYTLTGSGEAIAADPNGAVLFVGGSAGISTFTVNANDGSLTAIGSTATAATPTQITTDGSGKYVYALTGSTITAFTYTSGGVLGPVTGSPFTIRMAQIAGEITGRFLFGITAENGGGSGAIDNHIYVFSIAFGGGLNRFGSPVPTLASPVYLAVNPNGKFVYTFDQTSDSATTTNDPMEGFAFSTGTLTALGASPFTGLNAELGKFDQSGLYIFAVADVPNSSLSGEFAYGVDASGVLSSTLDHAGVPSLSFAVTDEP